MGMTAAVLRGVSGDVSPLWRWRRSEVFSAFKLASPATPSPDTAVLYPYLLKQQAHNIAMQMRLASVTNCVSVTTGVIRPCWPLARAVVPL